MSDEIIGNADVFWMHAMQERKIESVDQYKFIYIVEGELIVDIQTCGTCRPKTVTLTHSGSHAHIPKGAAIRIRNNKMTVSKYVLLHTEIKPSE